MADQSDQEQGSGRIGNAAKGAVVEGAKGAYKGGRKGAEMGAKVGSVVPGAGTAIGGVVGGAVGAGVGAGEGAAKGTGKGLAKKSNWSNSQSLGEKAAGKANKAINQGLEKGAQSAASAAGGPVAGEIAKRATRIANKIQKKAVGFILGDSEEAQLAAKLIIILSPIIFFILMLLILMGDPSAANPDLAEFDDPGTDTSFLTLAKTGPSQANNGDLLNYQITVNYPSTADDIIITDTIPVGTEYVSSDPVAVFDLATNTASWSAKTFPGATIPISNLSTTLTLTLLATKDNSTLINVAEGTVVGGTSGGGGPASDNNCGGKYAALMTKNRFFPKNFGDPSCELTGADYKDKIYAELKAKDPANADWWFNKVLPCESGYQSNNWNDPDNRPATPDGGGAWGMFQDGSSIILPDIPPPSNFYKVGKIARTRPVNPSDILQQPGLAPGTWGHGGANDRGDVDWRTQIDYASKLLPARGKGYWACA